MAIKKGTSAGPMLTSEPPRTNNATGYGRGGAEMSYKQSLMAKGGSSFQGQPTGQRPLTDEERQQNTSSAGPRPPEQGQTPAPTSGGSPQGLFNFQSLMDQFYNWKPSEDDVAGQQLKNTFQGDFIQTVLNNQMSKDLAYTNAEVATGQMTTAAALELANQTQIMKDEFDYGMQKMGAEYDYQSKFATDQANIKLNEMSHSADLTKNQTLLEGDQNRLNIQAQGYQDASLQEIRNQGALDQIKGQGVVDEKLLDIKGEQAIEQLKEMGINEQALQELKTSGAIKQILEQGGIDKAIQEMKEEGALNQIGAQGIEALKQIQEQGGIDVNKILEQGKVDVENIKTQGSEDVKKIGAQGDIDLQLQDKKGISALEQITKQGDVDVLKIGAQGTEAIKQIEAQGFLDSELQKLKGSQAIKQIGEQGSQERKTMEQATKEDTKKQKRDSSMARSLAGMF